MLLQLATKVLQLDFLHKRRAMARWLHYRTAEGIACSMPAFLVQQGSLVAQSCFQRIDFLPAPISRRKWLLSTSGGTQLPAPKSANQEVGGKSWRCRSSFPVREVEIFPRV